MHTLTDSKASVNTRSASFHWNCVSRGDPRCSRTHEENNDQFAAPGEANLAASARAARPYRIKSPATKLLAPCTLIWKSATPSPLTSPASQAVPLTTV